MSKQDDESRTMTLEIVMSPQLKRELFAMAALEGAARDYETLSKNKLDLMIVAALWIADEALVALEGGDDE